MGYNHGKKVKKRKIEEEMEQKKGKEAKFERRKRKTIKIKKNEGRTK